MKYYYNFLSVAKSNDKRRIEMCTINPMNDFTNFVFERWDNFNYSFSKPIPYEPDVYKDVYKTDFTWDLPPYGGFGEIIFSKSTMTVCTEGALRRSCFEDYSRLIEGNSHITIFNDFRLHSLFDRMLKNLDFSAFNHNGVQENTVDSSVCK